MMAFGHWKHRSKDHRSHNFPTASGCTSPVTIDWYSNNYAYLSQLNNGGLVLAASFLAVAPSLDAGLTDPGWFLRHLRHQMSSKEGAEIERVVVLGRDVIR
jgi:hypothetical protein